jgi:hypothetical protein
MQAIDLKMIPESVYNVHRSSLIKPSTPSPVSLHNAKESNIAAEVSADSDLRTELQT